MFSRLSGTRITRRAASSRGRTWLALVVLVAALAFLVLARSWLSDSAAGCYGTLTQPAPTDAYDAPRQDRTSPSVPGNMSVQPAETKDK